MKRVNRAEIYPRRTAGEIAPDFTLPAVPAPVSLTELRSRGAVIVVFYTEDSTPLCTRELTPFTSSMTVSLVAGAGRTGASSPSSEDHDRRSPPSGPFVGQPEGSDLRHSPQHRVHRL